MAQLGLLMAVSADEMRSLDREASDAAERQQAAAIESGLSAHIARHWEINRRARNAITPILEQCLRQREGEYDPGELAQIAEQGGSTIYMSLTATRVRTAVAWLNDIITSGGQMFGIEPTAVPEVPPEIKRELVMRLNQELQAAQMQGIFPDEGQISERFKALERRVRDALEESAATAAEQMEALIADQLQESGFEKAMSEFLDDFCTHPAAVLKGPVYRVRNVLEWGLQAQPRVARKLVAEDERVSPFDCYPSPGARSPQEGHFIEVVRYTAADLHAFAEVPCYKSEAIRAVLDDGQQHDWLRHEARNLERDRLQDSTDQQNDGLIWGLHYWGSAKGRDLLQWGVPEWEVEDELAEYEIEAIKLGHHIIKCAINKDPLFRRPYQMANWQNSPGSFWGKSLPQLMRDIQRMCNAAGRALSNNMGVSSGPQVVVLKDLLPEGGQVTGLHPWKVWEMVSDRQGRAAQQPIHFFQPPSNAQELLGVYNAFEQKADDATSVPRYSYGNAKMDGGAKTMGGLSMLLEAAGKAIKEAVRHIDIGVIRPRVERQYTENMLYENDPSIKGDLRVVARGASANVMKSATHTKRNEFLAVVSKIPAFQQLMGLQGFGKLLKEMVRDMDMDEDMVPDSEKIAAMEQAVQERAQQGQGEDPRLQVEQMRLEDRQRDRELQMQVAQMEMEGRLIELAHQKDIKTDGY